MEVAAELIEAGYWRITIVAYDYLGELSLICGLFFAHGLSIVDGHVYTYEAATSAAAARGRGRPPPQNRRRVHRARHAAGPDRAEDSRAIWRIYATDLAALLRLLEGGRQREAQGELAKRVALAVRGAEARSPALHPIDIEIDNGRVGPLHGPADRVAGHAGLSVRVHQRAGAQRHPHRPGVGRHRGQPRAGHPLRHRAADAKITSPERQRELRAATVLVKHFTHLLPQSPDPELALLHFNEYLGELFARPSWPDELASLERPEVLDALARLLGVSDFLWDDFLRMQYANLFPVVQDVDALASGKTRAQLAAELAAELAAAPDPAAATHGAETG